MDAAARVIREVPGRRIIDEVSVSDADEEAGRQGCGQNTRALQRVSGENRTPEPGFAPARTRGSLGAHAVLFIREHQRSSFGHEPKYRPLKRHFTAALPSAST